MKKISQLQQSAINAAKQQDWATAVTCNQQLLEFQPNDLGALNRLGVAYQQLGEKKRAKDQFEKVLHLDKSNPIAKKHLEKLNNNQHATAPTFSREHFIEEPGTTKVVELHRLANKEALEQLHLGQECFLKTKNRYISIETASHYVGALPEDLSFRLSKLIKTGNEYSCFIHSVSAKSCSVYLKEVKRAKRNDHIHSFPTSRTSVGSINDLEERFLIEEDVPVNIVETDTDEEKTLDDVKGDES